MPDHTELERLREVMDELFHDRARITRRDLYSAAAADDRLTSGVLGHLNEVPEGSYTHQGLVEAINKVIERRGEQDELGLLAAPRRIAAVEDTFAAERAIEDDSPLEALNPESTGTQQEAPEFREP